MLSGQSWFTAPTPRVYGPVQPPVIAPVYAGKCSIAVVSGFPGFTNVAPGGSITGPETGFILSEAPVGATYTFSVTSSGGGTPITGSGAVGSSAPQYVLGMNVAMLPNGILTYTVRVSSGAGCSVVTAATTLDQAAPAGYSIQGPGAITPFHAGTEPIIPDEASDTGFMFVNAELGARYCYTVTSSGGGAPLTGTGTITEVDVGPRPKYPGEIVPDYMIAVALVTGINVSSLPDGTLTFVVTVTNGAGTGAPATATATLTHAWPDLNRPYPPFPKIMPVTATTAI
jgi:hypothetical protein